MTSSHAEPNYSTYREIVGQPEAWRATLDDLQTNMAALRDYLQAHEPGEVLFSGCGSPYFLSLTAAALCRVVAKIPGEAQPSSNIWLFPEMTLTAREKPLLVVISRSGETTEILKAVEQFQNATNGPVIAVTCYEESALAVTSPFRLITQDAREIGLAQTRSFTSMLIDVQAIIFALANQPLSARFLTLPTLGKALIERYSELAQRIGTDSSINQFVFLGSAPYYGLACEAMLKMKEMSLSGSEAFHFLEFRHGPMTMVTPRTLIVGLLSEAAFSHERAVLAEMRAMGARTLAVTPLPVDADAADDQIILPDGLTDVERGPLYLPVLHLMAYHRTLSKGLNPDKLQNLNAYVSLDLSAIEGRARQR